MSDRAREYLAFVTITVGALLVLGAGAYYLYASVQGLEVPPEILQLLTTALVAIVGPIIGYSGASKAQRLGREAVLTGRALNQAEQAGDDTREVVRGQTHQLDRLEAALQRSEDSQQRISNIEGKLERLLQENRNERSK